MMNEIINLNEQDVFGDVTDVVKRAITIGDPLIALEFGSRMKKMVAVHGLALADLLYQLKSNWHLFQAAGIEGELEDLADVHMDIRPATTKKYIDMWKNIFANGEVPDDIKGILTERPIGDLLLLTAAVGEGSLSGEDLKAAALSADKQALREYVQHARGLQTSAKTAITLCVAMVDRGNMKKGTLFAKQGNKKVILGVLYEQDSDLGEKAIEALIHGRPIYEVFQ